MMDQCLTTPALESWTQRGSNSTVDFGLPGRRYRFDSCLPLQLSWGAIENRVSTVPVIVFDTKGIPATRRERIETAVQAAGKHIKDSYEAWITTDPFLGGVRVLIYGTAWV